MTTLAAHARVPGLTAAALAATGGGQTTVWQQTLKRAIHSTGVGLHSGQDVTLRLIPAEPDTGIRFHRTDKMAADGGPIVIPARYDHVVDTTLCTVIGNDGVTVGTIEHLMSALAGAAIDNLIVEIDGPEVPILDGSAEPFVFLIDCAGVAVQPVARRAFKVLRPIEVKAEGKAARLSPAAGSSFDVSIDFDCNVIRQQSQQVSLVNGNYRHDVARARTFGFLADVEKLRQMGLARGGSLANAIVIDDGQVLNPDGLRWPDEFARHKVLDAIGDLYLAGGPILGHFDGVCTGHADNNRLLRALFADPAAWVQVDLTTAQTGFAGGQQGARASA